MLTAVYRRQQHVAILCTQDYFVTWKTNPRGLAPPPGEAIPPYQERPRPDHGALYRTPAAAFDVQFPFANEASAMTRATDSLSALRRGCIAMRRDEYDRGTPTTRRANNDEYILSVKSRSEPASRQILARSTNIFLLSTNGSQLDFCNTSSS